MTTWPSTLPAPDRGLEEELFLPQLRTEFESGAVQSRRRATRARRRWPLMWSALTETHYQTLEEFFLANQGGTFTWTHPVTSTSYTCQFSGDSLKSGHNSAGYRSADCPIEEC